MLLLWVVGQQFTNGGRCPAAKHSPMKDSCQNSYVRRGAAYALGKLGKKSDTVLPAVIQWLEQHQDSENIGSGIDALWDLLND